MKLKKLISFTIYICFAILLTSCIGNNLGDSNNNNKAGFKGQLASNTMTMNIDWSIDKGTDDIRQTLLADMGWHLLTAKVSKTDSSTKPTPVQGLQAVVYPKPSPQNDRGQKIELEDINCKDAIFSKVGDSCSVYFKISYDNPKITDDDVRISINVAPVNYPTIPSSGAFTTNIRSYFNYGNYRAINSFEKKYYQGSTVVSNPLLYKMLLMQNASLSSLNIITISAITNPAFSLIHRTSVDNDPYYGTQNECSLTANASNKQVNQLAKLHDYCILVYKASDNSSRDYESQAIEINTNAEFFFPAFATNYYLKARYEHGDPIPSQTKNGANFMVSAGAAHPEGTSMKMDMAGALVTDAVPTPYPFRLVNLDYTFSPGTVFDKAPSEPLYRDGILNVLEDKNTNLISSGTQILTDASTTNPVTVGNITLAIPANSGGISSNNSWACGGARAVSDAYLTSNVALAKAGYIHVKVNGNSNGNCGNWAPQSYEADIPLEGYEATIYNVNQRGCGDEHWDIGGMIRIRTDGCNGSNCAFTTYVTASHHGVDDQCNEDHTTELTLNFKRPQVYLQLSNLSNFNTADLSKAKGAALGGQKLKAWIGGEGNLVAQNITCDFGDPKKPVCDGIGTFSNGLSSTVMSYMTSLLDKDALIKGTVDFTRSSGYDLANFTIDSEN